MIAMTLVTSYPAAPPAAAAGGRPAVRTVVKKTYVECAACGFEPPGGIRIPRGHCPKCYTWSWRRAVRRVEPVEEGAHRLRGARR